MTERLRVLRDARVAAVALRVVLVAPCSIVALAHRPRPGFTDLSSARLR